MRDQLVTLIGREKANFEMYALLIGAYVALLVAAATEALPWPALIALVTIPFVRPIMKIIRAGGNPRKVNYALFRTVQLHMRFGALMIVGLGFWWAIESV